MAFSSSSSSTLSMLLLWKFIFTLSLIFLVLNQCAGSRSGGMTWPPDGGVENPKLYEGYMQNDEAGQGVQVSAFIFNMLPKGVPIPPSGPSQRHNPTPPPSKN
ncbi:hypothetical protein NMG60_11036077 [Bertholletia excelsa]